MPTSLLCTKLLKVPGVNKAKDSGAAGLTATASDAGEFMTRVASNSSRIACHCGTGSSASAAVGLPVAMVCG
jgi:hypothetical protein